MNQSVPGRIVAIMWSLTGLVLNGILIGSIISSLYVNNQGENPVLYNTEVRSVSVVGYSTFININTASCRNETR